MPVHDFTSQRLYVVEPLTPGAGIICAPEQHNYLRNVLRMQNGDHLLVFNGRDGEWRVRLDGSSKKQTLLLVEVLVRPQEGGPDVVLMFAPLKRARLDYMVQKAVEMGVARLLPVLTRHTLAERVNVGRMRANIVEAAEQCGILRLPEAEEPVKLDAALKALAPERRLVFCDEAAPVANPLEALRASGRGPLAVLIGPEGGFAAEERAHLMARTNAIRLSLGPRILRADTAAVAALALVNAAIGDWC